MPQAIESNMIRVDLWEAFTERPSEANAHIVKGQHYPLDVGDNAGERLLLDFLLSLPVVAIPHAGTPL